MLPLDWDVVRSQLTKYQPEAERWIEDAANWVKSYPANNDNPEQLSVILANLNRCVLELGNLQARYERLKTWSDKRYEIEKSLEVVRIVRDEKKSASYAKEAKYENVKQYLDAVVDSSAMYMRVQNARSTARDTTEAIRSRISQIKGSIRSS